MAKATQTQLDLSNAVDAVLLDIIKNGRPVFGEDGLPLKDEDGKEIRRPCSAADIQAANQRLRQIGVSSIPTESNDIGQVMKHMREQGHLRLAGGGKLPDVDDETEDAAVA